MHPTALEMRALRAMSGGELVTRGDMPGVGEGTLAGLVAKGWIETAEPSLIGRPRWRIAAAGEAALALGPAPRARKPTRLKALPSQLRELPPKLAAPKRR